MVKVLSQIPETMQYARMQRSAGSIESQLSVRCSLSDVVALELASDNGNPIHVELAWQLDNKSQVVIAGKVMGSVTMTCQRCLEACPVSLDSEFEIRVLQDESRLDDFADKLEFTIAENGLVGLKQLVAEEIILNLPVAPKHDDVGCMTQLTSEPSLAVEV